MRRRGSFLIEMVVAALLIALLGAAMVKVAVQSGKLTASGANRLILELRARRYLDELATTSWPALVACNGRAPIALGDPGDDETYARLVASVRESVTVEEVAGGLMEARVKLEWPEVSTGRISTLAVSRLIARPTLSLESRFRMD